MPHVTSRAPRMPKSRCPSSLPADRNISSSFTQVIVKTPANQEDFTVADDISVREFKEKLSAHFKCQTDQLVLVFMGRLLKDQDTLSQRGITDGHTIYLVIKSKNGSRSLAHSSQNLPADDCSHQDRHINGNSSGVCQPIGMRQAPVKSGQFGESHVPKVQNQNLEVNSPQCTAQMLESLHVQQFLSNVEFTQQFISESLDKQQLIQQNPEVAHLLDNSETLWQTLELVRNLAIIQEIMQTQQPAQSLEHLPKPQPYLGLETIPGGNNVMGQSYADFSDQMFNSMQDPFGGNPFTALLAAQVAGQVQPSPLSPPSSQEQRDQQAHLPTTQVICTGSSGLSTVTPTNATSNRLNYPSRTNTAMISTKGQSHVCAILQPDGMLALPGIEVIQQLQEEYGDGSTSVCSSDQRSEEDLQLSDEQASLQITGGMAQMLMNHPHLAAQIMLFRSMTQLSEQRWQPPPTFLQQSRLSNLLLALANPKASQAILQIEQGLQLLATEAPILLPCFAPYLSDLCWLPGPSCSYPDTVLKTWNGPVTAEPKRPECCHKSGAVLHSPRFRAGDTSQSLQAPKIRFRKQMKFLQAMGFKNYHANLQALIATEGDTNAAICKLQKSLGS
ncbi:ubiquilin-like protein isoform X1 [Fukomys damarensis]|uniref:Ubiquilin-like protein n=1 Tax=Fukomys damarensis TaxID=885580 RepID=A0A091E0I6_FUKDA|nr:ubiquilin-like protein isoform X1 [Fukomys damarensis]KFO36070.1 Ubiquilin-like protein [Fukomys damarensis]